MKKPLKVEIDGVLFDENIESVRVFFDPDPEPEPEPEPEPNITQGMIAAVDFSQAKVIQALRDCDYEYVTAVWVSENVDLRDMGKGSVSSLLSRLKTTFYPPLATNDSEAGDGTKGRWWRLTERGRKAILVGTTPNSNERLERLFHQW